MYVISEVNSEVQTQKPNLYLTSVTDREENSNPASKCLQLIFK